MKKISIILAALAACFSVSCTKEAPTTEPQDPSAPAGMKKVTITASIDASETKTSYDADGKFSWTEGDQISVLGSDGCFYTFTTKETAASTSFFGYLPADVTLETYALYPADDGHTYDVNEYYPYGFNILGYKDLTLTNSADLPLHAESADGENFPFKNMSGGFKFTIDNIDDIFNTVDVTISTASLKISGVFPVRKSSSHAGYITYGSATEEVGEKEFKRKLKVIDNTVQIYLPYSPGMNLWGDTTIEVVGYDDNGDSSVLLSKSADFGSITHSRGTIYPVASISAPDYFPPVDWTKVDWTADNVASYVQEDWMYSSYPEYSDIKELKAFADEYYLYARVTPTKVVNQIRFFLADKGDTKSGDLWMWENTGYTTFYKSDRATVTDNLFSLSYKGAAVELKTETVDESLVWNMAIPRSAGEWTASSGSVYVGFITYGDGFEAPIPKVFGEMLEVTLP